MGMSKVALVRCESYEYEGVRNAVSRGLDLVGGAGKFVKVGQRLLLKPNLLVGAAPGKCVTTHPSVFRAVAELLRETGAVVSYGDSPGIGGTSSVAGKCGIRAIAEEIGIPAADFKTPVEVFFENGVQNRKFIIAKAVSDNDVIVSLPKLKTHGFEKFTGCVKNQFGCIPGMRKSEYHVKIPDPVQFAQMLVDLNNFIHPALYVMDGIWAMEGNGPRGGDPRKMNILLFSSDPIALDATVCRIIGLKPEYVPTIAQGYKSGSGTYLEQEIELVGDDFDSFRMPDFAVERSPLTPYRGRGIKRFLSNSFVPRPTIDTNKCAACGECVTVCPTEPKSIDWVGNDRRRAPRYNYRTCIRCYCCQELCPERAISIRYPLARRIFWRTR